MVDASPKVVSAFEAGLVAIARHLVHQSVPFDVRPIIAQKQPRPQSLSENAIALVREALGKGCILFLVRHGGWRLEKHLADGRPVAGRTWERHPLPDRALHFGRSPLDFLMWLACDRPQQPSDPWRPGDRTPADELFFALAIARLAPHPEWTVLFRDRTCFALNGLARLASPDLFAAPTDFPAPEFVDWFRPPRVAMLEALQPWLAERYRDLEFDKATMTNWAALGQWGQSQTLTLTAYLAAAKAAGRCDLARFLIDVNRRLFDNGPRPVEFWFGGLSAPGPERMADRVAVRRAAVAIPRAFGILADWTREFRGIGYFDDGYPAAQAWLAEWEAADGDRLAEAARQAVAAAEPLQV